MVDFQKLIFLPKCSAVVVVLEEVVDLEVADFIVVVDFHFDVRLYFIVIHQKKFKIKKNQNIFTLGRVGLYHL